MKFDDLGRPKKLLVFVNPFGGKKCAAKIFAEQVKPLFDDAQIQLTIQGYFIISTQMCFVLLLVCSVLLIEFVLFRN